MTTKHRPSLLRRLLAWRARPIQHDDPADMGTEIGLEYFLAQASGHAAAKPAAGHTPARPWQASPH